MPYCPDCGSYVPEGMPHSCGRVPAYTPPGLNEDDRTRVISIDQKTADAITKLNEAILALGNLDQAMTWAKNKLLAIHQDIDTLQVSVDLLNEKIP